MEQDKKDDGERAGKEIAFYRERGFKGAAEQYSKGDDITFWEGDGNNDRYNSLKVTGKVKVHCYQHSHKAGIHLIFRRGQYEDLDVMRGLSKFWISDDRDPAPPAGPSPPPAPEPEPEPNKPHDWGLAFRVVDDIRNGWNEEDRYRGEFAIGGLGKVLVSSQPTSVPDADQRYVSLSGRGDIDQINCAIHVFHENTNILVASAQIVFKYRVTTGEVSIVKNVPAGLKAEIKIEQRDNTRFDVTLSLKEGVEPPQDLLRTERAAWNGTSAVFEVDGTGTVGARIVAARAGAPVEKQIVVV